MTAKKLYGTLKYIVALDDQLRLQNGIEAIRDALNNLVSAPAQPQHQSSLATALEAFSRAAAKLAGSITPAQAGAIAEMGGEEFFDPSIADKVKASISSNAMTPSVARDFVQDLTARRSGFLATVRSAIQSLERLNINEAELSPGSADLAFLIPPDLFDRHLSEFAKELSFISNLIQHISEGSTGKAEQVELEGLSSSLPTVMLGASLATIATLATIVNRFLEAWERIQKIRKIRNELTEIGMKGTAVEELTEQITATVDEVVEESTEIVLLSYKGDQGRRNELENALRQDTRRLFGQIERGLTIEFRAEPKADAAEEDKNAIETVSNLSRQMQFPAVANEPLLLGGGEVLEGEIHGTRVTKRTSTHKSSVSKKESHKVIPQEPKENS